MPQQCAGCSQQSPDGAKFCLECGTPFARACPSCGHPVSGGKFCMECGTPLTAAAPPPRPHAPAARATSSAGPVSERRTTTVLFGDLVAFTTLSESRDPEEVRELLSEYFGVARTVVSRYGGTIEKFIGDAVMAVWGVPVSHEDDAERAVRAGLDLVAEVAALGARVGAPNLSMRVGIVTGSVAVTLGAVNEGMVAGDAVNTAARVQTAAAPGTVWTDQETRGLTAAAIAYSDMGDHTLKGKAEPARLFRADAIVAAVGGAQRVDGLEAPMTGRESEMRQVKELFHATQADGRARVVLVSGLPGLGKSRIGWEFEKYVDGLSDVVRWHRGRCLSYGDGVAYWAFAEMVRSRLGLLEGESVEAVRAKARAGVEAVSTDADEAAWLVSRLEALLGVGDHTGFDRTDLFAAWTTFFERVGGDEPLVLLFEDVHHADAGLLDLLEHTLETSRAKLYVLVLTRPELLEKRSSLASGRRATVIDLQPLPEPAMTTMVDGLVYELPDRARAAIVTRAEGVPLYAVETVRSLIDRDAVVARDGRYVFTDHDHTRVDLEQLAAPTSLQTLIAARLDALSSLERRTVQDASVLGLAFRQSGLMALSEVGGYELDVALAALVRKGVVEVHGDPRSPERGQYRFLQALVREVAYGTLARRDRRERHLAAADHLQGEGEETVEALAGVISQHLLDALEATSAHDQARPELAARARGLLVATAERAESLGSSAEALRATLTALSLEPGDEETVELQVRGARLATAAGENVRAEELGQAALVALHDTGRDLDAARVLLSLCWAAIGLGKASESADLARDGLVLTAEADPQLRVDLLYAQTTSLRSLPDQQARRDAIFALVALAEDLGDPDALVTGLNSLALLLVDAGSPTAYLALLERCVSLARQHRLIRPLGRSVSNLCAEVYPHDLRRGVELAEEAVAINLQVGESYLLYIALANAMLNWWLRGDLDRVTTEVTGWVEDRPASASDGVMMLVGALGAQARGLRLPVRDGIPDSEDPYDQHAKDVYLALRREEDGDVVGAAAAAALSARTTYADGDMLDDFEVCWAPAVELQLRAGDLDEAERLLALASPLLGGRARPLLLAEHARLRGCIATARGHDPEADLREAEQRHEGYGAPYLLALTRLELGRWLVIRGRLEEGTPLLARARETFVGLGALPSIEEVDAVAQTGAADLPQLVGPR